MLGYYPSSSAKPRASNLDISRQTFKELPYKQKCVPIHIYIDTAYMHRDVIYVCIYIYIYLYIYRQNMQINKYICIQYT